MKNLNDLILIEAIKLVITLVYLSTSSFASDAQTKLDYSNQY